MSKILMFDTEHGSQTLGGEAEIQEMFNCPVLKPAQFDDFRNIITAMYTTQRMEVEKKISTMPPGVFEDHHLQEGKSC